MPACSTCPNRFGISVLEKENSAGLVAFHDNGDITYLRTPGTGCGADIVRAQGQPAERLADSIDKCSSPDERTVRKPGTLGRLGIGSTIITDCPAALRHFDDSSPTQVRQYFEGDDSAPIVDQQINLNQHGVLNA